jgi:hypothetical protein
MFKEPERPGIRPCNPPAAAGKCRTTVALAPGARFAIADGRGKALAPQPVPQATFAAAKLTLESVTLLLLVMVIVAAKSGLSRLGAVKVSKVAVTLNAGVKPFSVAVPTIPPLIAEIVVLPAPITRAKPEVTLATPEFEDVQPTEPVMTRVVPSL